MSSSEKSVELSLTTTQMESDSGLSMSLISSKLSQFQDEQEELVVEEARDELEADDVEMMRGECARPDPNTTNRLENRQHGERLLPPWSLRDSCLWKVRNDILNWSREGSLRSKRAYVHYQPFTQYPIQLRQEILDSMLRLKPDGREVVSAVTLLIQSGIFAFDLNCLNECDSHDVFRVINSLIRHGNLIQELNVGGQWLYDPRANYLVCKLLRNAPNVKKLVLQEATEEGRELETILASCYNLRHLEIRHPSVDDKYLELLLQGREPKSSAKLTSVIVPSTVKAEGLLTLLKVFPNLQYLECSHLEATLDLLEAKEGVDKDWWVERGRGILGVKTTQPMGPKGVSKLVHWFPNLKTVALEVQEYMNLTSLADLWNLKSLELRNSATLPASYIQCVLPLLNQAGGKLTHLGLEHFDVVDLSKTSLSCPELNSLTLRWFTLLGTSTVKVKGHVPFEKLQSMCLRPRTNRHINKEACELLLSNCTGMRHVELYCCHGLDDNTVQKLVKTNPLASLRTLILRHGHGLSSKGIQTLICRSKHLLYWDFGEVNSTKTN